jgi:hypothetical protein
MHTCKKIKEEVEIKGKKDHTIYSDQSLASDGPKQAPKTTPYLMHTHHRRSINKC